MNRQTCYTILEIENNASEDDIKKAYRIIMYIFLMFFSFYLICIAAAKTIETIFSFPGVLVNTKQYTAPNIGIPNLEFEEIHITAKNGDIINGLFIDNNAEKTVYYFHGNG